ncbi:hypothetical protein BC628DRAFT_845011 [Trametes gibbosa]|nr:hypothetical protein BC628DRAFT_845011 [Trametes gibbosa]
MEARARRGTGPCEDSIPARTTHRHAASRARLHGVAVPVVLWSPVPSPSRPLSRACQLRVQLVGFDGSRRFCGRSGARDALFLSWFLAPGPGRRWCAMGCTDPGLEVRLPEGRAHKTQDVGVDSRWTPPFPRLGASCAVDRLSWSRTVQQKCEHEWGGCLTRGGRGERHLRLRLLAVGRRRGPTLDGPVSVIGGGGVGGAAAAFASSVCVVSGPEWKPGVDA